MSAVVKQSSGSDYVSYSLSQILQIADANSTFELSQDVIDKINNLSNKVGAPTYNRTPVFNRSKDESKSKRKKVKNIEINDSDWEAIRNFQVTQRDQKEGIDKIINDIRGDFNKLSDKNYDKLIVNIQELFENLIKHKDLNDEHKETVAKLIFDIATTNKFYSKLYARLYKELTVDYLFIKTEFENKFSSFISLFKDINYVNPDDDYNLFCKINKENESRRALSMFIVNMVKLDVLSNDYLVTIIKELIVLMQTKIKTFGCKEQVDELSENIYTLITESHKEIKHHADFTIIHNFVSETKVMKSKDHESLSSKAVFKFMDIYDFMNK